MKQSRRIRQGCKRMTMEQKAKTVDEPYDLGTTPIMHNKCTMQGMGTGCGHRQIEREREVGSAQD